MEVTQRMPDMSATRQIAEFVSNQRTLPLTVVERAKLHIADTLACILAGSSTHAASIFMEISAPSNHKARVIVPGLGHWDDPSLAAMLTGICAHADDFDDTSEQSMNGHPSAPILSALLPTACMTNASGLDVIRAYAVGVEVACKLGSALGAAHTRRGWHTMSTLGALGATAAAAALRGLDESQTERAFAIGCSFAGGVLGNTGTMTKTLHCGRAAQAGYLAAALAERGFTAGTHILEAPHGFLDALTDRSKHRIELPALGEEWELLTPGLAVKLYPCCSCTHLSIDAAIEISKRHSLDIQKIAHVSCFVRNECTDYLRFPNPKTGIEAKFSMNFTVAVALARGKITLDDFDTAALSQEDIALLMPKVHMKTWAGEEESGLVEVVLTDGTRFTATRDVPRGSPGDPASWADILAKLQDAEARARNRMQTPLAMFFASLQSMETQSQFSDLL